MSIDAKSAISVLLVEDNDIDAAIVMGRLGRFADFRLHWVASQSECLDFLGREAVDAILLDMCLGDAQGTGLIDTVLAACGAAPVVILTSTNDQNVALAAVHRGCQDYLIKGTVDGPAIRRTILYAIERKAFEAEAGLHAEVFRTVSEGITITDSNGTILSVNPAFCRITGYSEEEVIGKNPRFLSSGRHSPDFYQAMWSKLLETGSWSGEVWNRAKSGEIYPEWLSITSVGGRRGAARRYVGVFLDISALKRNEDALIHLAHHDALTGLPNRLLLVDRVEHAIDVARREGGRVALMFLDLDRFKIVNDSLGHMAGDKLLRVVADRLRGTLRRSDTLARLGGDEFVVVVPNVPSTAELVGVTEKIVAALDSPVDLDGHTVTVGASIGVSIFPEDGQDCQTLMKNADTAMYRAKQNGRNTFCFYDSEMNTQALDRLWLEGALRRALVQGEFQLYYQPQIDLQTGAMTGVEALIRWNCPDRGIVAPGMFIPVAEESQLISRIGLWVLEEACRQLVRWQDGLLAGVKVAINVSGRQFLNRALADCVSDLLQQYGLDPSQIEIELTESTVMAEPERAIEQLQRLRQIGVHVSVDDFGTGYSSLGYLKRLPLNTIKVDRSFVHDIDNQRDNAAIVTAILGLADALNMSIIAEGVETEGEERHLRGAGSITAQGFRYARPMPADQLAAWVGNGGGAQIH